MTGRERVRAQDAGCAYERDGERLARSRGVASHEIELKRDGIGGIDRNVCKAPEARRDAVDRLAAVEAAIDELACPLYALARGRRDRDGGAAGDGLDLFERQMAPVEFDWIQNFDQSACVGFANGGPFWITMVSWSRSAMLRGSRPCQGVPLTQIESRPPRGAESVAACVQFNWGPQTSKNWPSVNVRFTGDSI